MTRLEQLQSLLESEPDDTFLRYALGMELKGLGRMDEAIQHFESLMKSTPPYVPAFFMAGQAFAELGNINSARSVLREGIDFARTQGDNHAAGEMSEFLVSLGSFGD